MPVLFKKIHTCLLILIISIVLLIDAALAGQTSKSLLTDPFLQNPGTNSIYVVWFTDFKGKGHFTTYGGRLDRTAKAKTTQLTRVREKGPSGYVKRNIWRHECFITELPKGIRTPYFVTSESDEGIKIESGVFSLQPLPSPGQSLKILLTSDHQQKPMAPANLQKVVETVGTIDAVFHAGDLTNVPDNAKEWFDNPDGLGFFAALQGRSRVFKPDHQYTGGQILQYAPIYPCVGNHEVMGRYNGKTADYDLGQPKWYAEMRFDQNKIKRQDKNKWIQDNSFNTITYEEIFNLPSGGPGGEQYYHQKFGDIHLVSLFITRHWRMPNLKFKKGGKYHEADPLNPDTWLFGDFIYEEFGQGSDQFAWLQRILQSKISQDARYRIVMTHQTSRGAGGNSIPLLSDPKMAIEYGETEKQTKVEYFQLPPKADIWTDRIQPLLKKAYKIRYDYPRAVDHWRTSIEPLLKASNVHMVLHGHSHLWQRMYGENGIIYLESSNVGNTYEGFLRGYKARKMMPPLNPKFWDPRNYPVYGDPYGSELTMPTIFSPIVHKGRPMPIIDSNKLTVFSVLETESGIVSSYVFDTRQPESKAKKFDSFNIQSLMDN